MTSYNRAALFFFATPHPDYSFRRFKDRDTDAIGKDKTHINCHPPQVWQQWCEAMGFTVIKQFGDGLWDVPYVPLLPNALQFALFGFPAFVQVMTQTTFMPLSLGCESNQHHAEVRLHQSTIATRS